MAMALFLMEVVAADVLRLVVEVLAMILFMDLVVAVEMDGMAINLRTIMGMDVEEAEALTLDLDKAVGRAGMGRALTLSLPHLQSLMEPMTLSLLVWITHLR